MLVLKGSKRPVMSLAFSPDGTLLASAGEYDCVRVWNALDGKPVATLPLPSLYHFNRVSVLFAPDNRHVILTDPRSLLRIFDLTTETVVKLLMSETLRGSMVDIAFASDRRLLVLCWGDAPGLLACDPATWEATPRLWAPQGDNYALAVPPEPGGMRAALSNGLLLDVSTGAQLGVWGERLDPYWVQGSAVMAWCPRKPLLAFRNGPGTIGVVNQEDGKPVTRLVVSKKHVDGFTFTPDGRHLIVACNDKRARLYDTGTWAERQTLDWGIGGLRCVAVAADGSRAAAGSSIGTYSGKVVIWDLD
jgi:WD40 repeat protein